MKKKILFLIPFAVSFLSTLTSCGAKADLTIWVDNKIQGVIEDRIKAFRVAEPDFKYSVRVDNVSEQTAATNMITDVQGGADIFIFAQDQFSRLITAGALSPIPHSENEGGYSMDKIVRERNDDGSVDAVTHTDEEGNVKLFAYPVTSDNGYFLYYDKTYFGDGKGDINSLESIIDTCKSNTKLCGFSIKDGFWYGAGFFMSTKLDEHDEPVGGPVCHSNWDTNGAGRFIHFEDNFQNDGTFAVQGMAKLYGSSCFLDSHNADDLGKRDAIVVCSGVWDYKTAKDRLGTNLGMAKLPTFKVGDQKYQMGSFSGYKLMGVKPHEDKIKAYWCAQLADYLTNEESQKKLLEQAGWGPSNKKVQTDAKDEPQLKALNEQNVYATPQGSYPNDWWKAGEDTICGPLKGKNPSKDEINKMLASYQSRIEKLVEPE